LGVGEWFLFFFSCSDLSYWKIFDLGCCGMRQVRSTWRWVSMSVLCKWAWRCVGFWWMICGQLEGANHPTLANVPSPIRPDSWRGWLISRKCKLLNMRMFLQHFDFGDYPWTATKIIEEGIVRGFWFGKSKSMFVTNNWFCTYLILKGGWWHFWRQSGLKKRNARQNESNGKPWWSALHHMSMILICSIVDFDILQGFHPTLVSPFHFQQPTSRRFKSFT